MSRKTKKLKNKLLVPFEWIGIGIGLCVIPWLPRRALFGLCDFLSAVMYLFDRRGKRRSLKKNPDPVLRRELYDYAGDHLRSSIPHLPFCISLFLKNYFFARMLIILT